MELKSRTDNMTRKNAVKQANEEISYLDDQKEAILGKLERLRIKKMISIAKVGMSMGKSSSYYSVVQNRGRALSVESIAKLAAVFGQKIELRLVRSRGRGANGTRKGAGIADGASVGKSEF